MSQPGLYTVMQILDSLACCSVRYMMLAAKDLAYTNRMRIILGRGPRPHFFVPSTDSSTQLVTKNTYSLITFD